MAPAEVVAVMHVTVLSGWVDQSKQVLRPPPFPPNRTVAGAGGGVRWGEDISGPDNARFRELVAWSLASRAFPVGVNSTRIRSIVQ